MMRSFEVLVIVDFQEFHHIEDGRRQRIVALGFFVSLAIGQINLTVLVKGHEIAADQDGHIVVAQQEHVADFERAIVSLPLGTVLQVFIDLEAAVCNLFFGLVGFVEDWA